jgi:hypothetical protein
VLAAFGHFLSFLILFVAVADAAERSGFANEAAAVVCGVLAIAFTRLYVRTIFGLQLDPSHRSQRVPAWAIAIYAAIGAAFVLLALRAGKTGPAVELLVGWAAGCNLLNYLWTRRLRPDTPAALDVVDRWLSARAAAHQTFSYTLCFLLLFGNVGAHAGLARSCSSCSTRHLRKGRAGSWWKNGCTCGPARRHPIFRAGWSRCTS